ncbi:conserved hypothetical protein [Ricinus communis]|uniref:Uncharacterized protein n=1 Tax=Ricinus communis TaxID=3988 RepID=B9T3M4_RICCO|nr:conserved hypothetical protein [Ricinus communis]
MAGVDHLEWGMDVEEWERQDLLPPAPHLLADDDEIAAHLHKEVGSLSTARPPLFFPLFFCCFLLSLWSAELSLS